jgi:hypothetical protein
MFRAVNLRGIAFGTVVLFPLTALPFLACNFEEQKASVPGHAPTLVSTAGDASTIATGLDGGTIEEPIDYPVLVSAGGSCGNGTCEAAKFETVANCVDCTVPTDGDGRCDVSECGKADCGTCWYAAPTAFQPGADGSAGKPFALGAILNGGVPAVKAGDTIWVSAGAYGAVGGPPMAVTLKGTANAPIRVEALPGLDVTIQPGIAASTAEYITFSRIKIVNEAAPRIGAARPNGIDFGKGLRLDDVQIYDTGARAAWVRTGDAVLNGCIVHGNGVRTAANAATYDGQGLRLEGNVGTVMVTGSLFTRNFTNAIDVEATATGGTITLEGNGFLDQPDGAILVNPKIDTAVQTVTLTRNLGVFRGNAGSTGADRGISIGVRDDANVRQDKVELRDNLLISLGTDKGEPLVSLVDYSGYIGAFGNELRGPNLVRTAAWPMTAQQHQWDANRYYVIGGADTGTYFDDAVLPAVGAPLTFASWRALGRDASSKLAFAVADETRILGTRFNLRELRAALFINQTVAKPDLTLDLRPYVRVGETYTLTDAAARGIVLRKATVFDGKPVTLPAPSAAPVALNGTPTDLAPGSQRALAGAAFYAIQVRISPP